MITPRFRLFACCFLSFHWFFRIFCFLLIGHCDFLVLISRYLIEKRSLEFEIYGVELQ